MYHSDGLLNLLPANVLIIQKWNMHPGVWCLHNTYDMNCLDAAQNRAACRTYDSRCLNLRLMCLFIKPANNKSYGLLDYFISVFGLTNPLM